jgi:DnaJ-domain-containing protein 1
MNNITNYIWLIFLAIYIISPIDAHPMLIDDLIAAVVMLYMLHKNSKRKKQYQQYYSHSQNQSQDNQTGFSETRGPVTLDKAYKLLGVTSKSSWDEISSAYKEKMKKSHPDKVSHLSEELQAKAKELTLNINEAIDLIRRHRGRS